jgi:hypothetical protein
VSLQKQANLQAIPHDAQPDDQPDDQPGEQHAAASGIEAAISGPESADRGFGMPNANSSREIKGPLGTAARERKEANMRGVGRVLFVAILLLIAGTLNIIYGIAAVGNAHFFNGTQYVFSSLHTWGWITIIVGIIELAAGFSLMAGRAFGRIIGIIAATIGALESLLSIGGTHPWWSLAIFALCVFILHGLVVYGEEKPAQT